MNSVNGFLKAQGQKLINGDGQEILLRGVGLGGWLLPEGYMWRFPDEGDRPRRIEKIIKDLVGDKKAEEFWEIYYERYTSEADICKIAGEGFNSVRVPINSRFLIDEYNPIRYNDQHLRIIDCIIDWCRKYNLYVILDLHGAPGGQTGTNIDDSENNKPELFTNEKNRLLTIELWRMLAERYRDEWVVGGYDLLNEPLPEWFSVYNGEVMPLYRDIITEIRKIDQNHMIILEGVHWATDWSIFDVKPDDNLMLQFHKYWNNPDTESIQAFLDKGLEWNVPIFMGEGGENNLDWYSGAFRLYEDQRISWNFWTWKKMQIDNSPCAIQMPSDWDMLISYQKEGINLDSEKAEKILWEFLDNIHIDRCIYHPEVVNALFRRPPVRIPAIFYGYEGKGISYEISAPSNKNPGFRINDGTDIRFVDQINTKPDFQHMLGQVWKPEEWMYVQLNPGDWLAYDFIIEPASDNVEVIIKINMFCAEGNGSISVSINGNGIKSAGTVSQSWETVEVEGKYNLGTGLHRVILKGETNTLGIKWIEIKPERKLKD